MGSPPRPTTGSSDFTPLDPTNSRSKIFRKKVPESSKEQNLNLPIPINYWPSIYIVQSLSHVWFFVTQWTTACQASLSLNISKSLPKFMPIALTMNCKALYIVLLLFSLEVVSDSCDPMDLQPARLLCLLDSPGKNTGVGCHFLLQGIFVTPKLNPGLLHCRQILLLTELQGNPPTFY